MEQVTVLAIVGPTAVGKSQLAMALAQRRRAEIVSVDSRQVYRDMDIGTAKPSPEDRARVPHHLIDVVDPDQEFTVAQYRRLALASICDVLRRGLAPLLVGGSGFYLRALEGIPVPPVPPDLHFRRAMEARAADEGPKALHRELAAVDPEAARRNDPNNVRRVIRALEVWRHTGRPVSQVQRPEPPPFGIRKIGLTMARDDLYRRIDGRVDQMMEAGFLDEVRRLADRGYGWDLPAMTGLGYRQLGEHLRGDLPLGEAVRKTKYATHRYARQQYAWFRPDDPAIRWFDVRSGCGEVVEALAEEAWQG